MNGEVISWSVLLSYARMFLRTAARCVSFLVWMATGSYFAANRMVRKKHLVWLD